MLVAAASAAGLHAQTGNAPSPVDYQRALDLREKYSKLTLHQPDELKWIEESDRFVYRRTVSGGHEFVLVDAEKQSQQPAFDHARLAAALNLALSAARASGGGGSGKANDKPITPETLPFSSFKMDARDNALEFTLGTDVWRCLLASYTCSRHPVQQPQEAEDNDDGGYDQTPRAINGAEHPKPSPDGQWVAFVENYNIAVRPAHAEASKKPTLLLSSDGSEGNYYALDTIAWSPDSKHLAAYRVRPGYRREVHYIESSPADQLQPRHSTMVYPKAGDELALFQPVLFEIAAHKESPIDNALFPNPWELTPFEWWKDSRGFTFEYNQRGHQIYRVIDVDATTSKARTLIEEASPTFINYEPLTRDQYDHGKHFRQDLSEGKEIVWASERDGWEHLYLFNGHTCAVERQITRGDWVVRAVDRVDEEHREIYFEASGLNPDEDPYYVHAYRIRMDGSGLTPLTPAQADHTVSYSPDGKYFVDTYSRVDLPPVMELRRTPPIGDSNTQDVAAGPIMNVDNTDAAALTKAGWNPPEPFHTAGRDGKTQIWGVIYKPSGFDPSRKYPVVEDIYAGPQGSFVPKSFSARAEPLTELGLVVVQIDGMGTNNRSRAFHDVAWRNLKDAGFPDRILWHKAVAAKYPWYDISRVGIFGTSAGGQSAMGALLFHPEFYKAAVSNSGCHDNRMDKIWWNEQWMGWPVGPWYSDSSNVDNAWRLQGKLLLVLGEMDKNVDPASTLQVVDRLIKSDKDFDLLFVPGGGHGAGGRYGERKLMSFFVRNLMGKPVPEWNETVE
jgi:dipeptidyl aminopeptidase/acylaminoacyl peptidase